MNTQDFGELPTTLRARLDAMAERRAPVSTVDVPAAQQAGDRVRRRRTATRLSAVAAVAITGLLCCTALPAAMHRPAGPPAGAVDPGYLEDGQDPIPLVAGTDPVGSSMSFGWLPPGFTILPGTSYSPGQISITAQTTGVALNAEVTHTSDFALLVDVRDESQALQTIQQVQQRSPETVDGRPATLTLGLNPEDTCVSSSVIEPPEDQQPKDPVGLITWTLADGRTAGLETCLPLGISLPDATAMVLHVARAATFVRKAVPAPFYLNVSNLPPSMRLLSWNGPVGSPTGDDWGFSMMVGTDPLHTAFSLGVSPVNPTDTTQQSSTDACKTADGLEICVSSGMADHPLTGAIAELGLQGLLDDVGVLGTNPANWTTDVFR